MQIAELRIARHDAAVRTENGGGEEVKNSRLFVEKQLLAFEEDYHIKNGLIFYVTNIRIHICTANG
ncbi:hypothetical protein P7H21_13060 [Paenibacillus larvae]|nr:hypothetical protein [Paenibacillus larvae]MDT2304694.1 hypothetical protein [Paenibacillus larvae]